ncbi:MAG TPA: bifunctional phosphopantothenoylcysteine decarboxylase/phosphopantothenate--cysteine ligase CoaBC [Caulobacteraceae bacterium]
MSLQGRRILLVVGAGVAAYKALELARLLAKAGARVSPVLTRAGEKFVTPLSLAALCGEAVHQDLFSLTEEAAMGHIELSRAADLVVVAPATADLIGKAASGLGDDLASTLLLATDKRVLMAPAMNVRMWLHPAVRANVAALEGRGVLFVGPDDGEMACGEYGPGRLAEPPQILEAIEQALDAPSGRPLIGRRALVTAGPTAEPLDPVRVLTNRSSGKQGYAIAEALSELGAEVTLVSGPTALSAPLGVWRVQVETAEQMLGACRAALPADVAVFVAAVADWRPETVAVGKIKKTGSGPPEIRLVENPDILASLSRPGPQRPRLSIGFAAETGALETAARKKLQAKGCDWIVANDVSDPSVVGGEDNAVTVIDSQGADAWPRASKIAIARRLARRIAEALA